MNICQNDEKHVVLQPLCLYKVAKHVSKIVVCFVLCFCLIWGYSYKEPAHAEAISLGTAIVGSVLISLCLSCLGLTMSAAMGDAESKRTLGKIYDDGGKMMSDCAYAFNEFGKDVVRVTPEVLQYVGDKVKELQAESSALFGTDEHTKYITKYFKNYGVIEGATDFNGIKNLFKFPTNVKGDLMFLNTNEFYDFKVERQFFVGETFNLPISADGKAKFTVYPTAAGDMYFSVEGYGSIMLCPAFMVSYTHDKHRVYTMLYKDKYSQNTYVLNNLAGDTYFGLTNRAPAIFPQDYARNIIFDGKSVGLNDTKEVVDTIKNKCGVVNKKTGEIEIPLTNTGSNTDLDARTRTQTQAQTLGQDIATEADKTAVETANATKNMSLPKPFDMPDLALPELIFKEKFPFCLPWDFYNAFSNLAAPATPPKFEYPIVLARLGINEKITLDFAPYEKLAAISRWAISFCFVVFLILQTRKLIGGD